MDDKSNSPIKPSRNRIQEAVKPDDNLVKTQEIEGSAQTSAIFGKDVENSPKISGLLSKAGGNPLTIISDNCLSKAQDSFGEDLEELPLKSHNMVQKIQSSASPAEENSNECLSKARVMLGEDLEDWNLKAPKGEFSQLKPVITTAAGKPLSISNDCISKVRDIFGEDLDDLPLNFHKMSLTSQNAELKPSVGLLTTASGKPLIKGEDLPDLSIIEETPKVSMKRKSPDFKNTLEALATEGGKSLDTSNDCLMNAQDIFGEDVKDLPFKSHEMPLKRTHTDHLTL